MVIAKEDFIPYLASIQNDTKPKIVVLPTVEKAYDIDLKTRQIETPKYLSVERDHKSEVVYFKVDRFFDYMDLTQTVCIIQYITPDNNTRIYAVPYYDIETYATEEKIIFPWCIDGGATATAGTIRYSIRFYKIDEVEQQFIYNLNTQPTQSKILYGMDIQSANADYDLAPTVYDEVLQALSEFSSKLTVWKEMYD